MTASNAVLQNPTLINPPNPSIAKATPDQDPILGSTPPAGAGSSTPLPAPTGDGSTPTLPFGNGVTPILGGQSGPIGTDKVDNTGFPSGMTPFSGSPVNTVSAPPATPMLNPQVNPDGPAGGDPAPNTGDTLNLQNTAITANPNAPKISDATAALAAKFGSTPTDINGGGVNYDRRGMLSSLIKDFDSSQAEADDNAYTQVGRRGAALGRIGSGMVSQDLDQIARQSAGDRAKFRNQLAADTIDKEIGDKVGDRAFTYGVNRDNQTAKTAAQQWAAAFGNTVAGQDYNQGADARAELRGERNYQDTTAQNAIDNASNAAKLKDNLTGSAFERALQRFQAGQIGNPTGAYQAAAGDASGQSDATLNALTQYLQSLGIGSARAA